MSSYDIHIEGAISNVVLQQITDLIGECVISGAEFTFAHDPELAVAVDHLVPRMEADYFDQLRLEHQAAKKRDNA